MRYQSHGVKVKGICVRRKRKWVDVGFQSSGRLTRVPMRPHAGHWSPTVVKRKSELGVGRNEWIELVTMAAQSRVSEPELGEEKTNARSVRWSLTQGEGGNHVAGVGEKTDYLKGELTQKINKLRFLTVKEQSYEYAKLNELK